MESIKVTFPEEINPAFIKKVIEGNLLQNSKYTCIVTYVGLNDIEGEYKITTNCAEAFYLIGMTASEILRKYNEKISDH